MPTPRKGKTTTADDVAALIGQLFDCMLCAELVGKPSPIFEHVSDFVDEMETDFVMEAEPGFAVRYCDGTFASVLRICSSQRLWCYQATIPLLANCDEGTSSCGTSVGLRSLATEMALSSRELPYLAHALLRSRWRASEYAGQEFSVLRAYIAKLKRIEMSDGRLVSNGRKDQAAQLAESATPSADALNSMFSVDSFGDIDWELVTAQSGLSEDHHKFILDYISERATCKSDPAAWKAIVSPTRMTNARLVKRLSALFRPKSLNDASLTVYKEAIMLGSGQRIEIYQHRGVDLQK